MQVLALTFHPRGKPTMEGAVLHLPHQYEYETSSKIATFISAVWTHQAIPSTKVPCMQAIMTLVIGESLSAHLQSHASFNN